MEEEAAAEKTKGGGGTWMERRLEKEEGCSGTWRKMKGDGNPGPKPGAIGKGGRDPLKGKPDLP